ncbi:hypothetical protein [Planctomycetes bacterium K23_9]|uniref:Glycosyltransferase RgtA/B/C/D-like domain-containing protein n=1 Tax=Stieleria marina TaxID=1930275 RepID=A0A517NN72_9BACT|nr:hypothetical protein K239x_05170 [Planctomycetes bacterium K23_9]
MKGNESLSTVNQTSNRSTADQTSSALGLLCRDLSWLIGIHVAIVAMLALASAMSVFAPFDNGDLRVAVAFTVFLAPGWWLALRFCPAGSGVDTRYAVAAIVSFVIHVWIAWPSSRIGLSFDAYYATFALIGLCAAFDRTRQVRKIGLPRYRISRSQLALNAAMLFFICAAYRVPHSNDIAQFLMQQIDMTAARNFSPSPIGMTAFDIDAPMPRWDTNAYHVWFSLLADVTRLPVEGLVKRWATVPMAVVSLLMLCLFVKRFVGKRTPDWIVVLAIVGPATLWFRSYNAYVYGMRVTNNFCLDKDFAMFWLIPAWLWFLHRALQANERSSWIMLVLLAPLCIAIHPMTPVYLCLLTPFVVAAASSFSRQSFIRSVCGAGLAFLMFLYVFTSGGAQAFHQEIESIISHDVATISTSGQSVHHWIGHYAAVESAGAELDTTDWSNGTFRLKPKLLWTGSALASLFLATALTCGIFLFDSLQRARWRVLAASITTLVILLALFALSGIALTARPHLYRGVERLHWFAFLPAIVAVACCIRAACHLIQKHVAAKTVQRIALACLIAHFCDQAWHIGRAQPTLLSRVPMLHSVFDFYAQHQLATCNAELARFDIKDGPLTARPSYLRGNDRVLILASQHRTPYWELRQAVWWPELYGEANALAVFGDQFLDNWQAYYDAVDWLANPNVDRWITYNKVTVIVDSRAGAENYVQSFAKRLGRKAIPIAEDSWRIEN